MSSDSNFRQAILGGTFTYVARPDPIPGDLRMSWGIAVLLLGVFYSRAKKSNVRKLQFMIHAVRIPEGREEVRGLLSGIYKPAEVSVRIEPSLNRAVALAHSMNLIKIERGTSISLTGSGESIAAAIVKEQNTLREEVSFLREIAPKMTDALMNRVWRLEDLL